jgi:hypothetical protein
VNCRTIYSANRKARSDESHCGIYSFDGSHLNPLLAIGRIPIEDGHEIVGLTGTVLRGRIEGIGQDSSRSRA